MAAGGLARSAHAEQQQDLVCRVGLVNALSDNLVANQLGWLAGDAVASIAIGCVLAGVAASMSRETMRPEAFAQRALGGISLASQALRKVCRPAEAKVAITVQ